MHDFKTGRFVFFIALLCACGMLRAADSYDVAGGSYRALREVDTGGRGTVVVTQFLHHGLINLAPKGVDPRKANEGAAVLVTTRAKKPVPFKILQLGPGDYCRIAFETEARTSAYHIYYGIPTEKSANANVKIPEWTATAGLLFEARRPEGGFDMNNLESVKNAFESSTKPIGADYVENVYHGFNPLTLRREPFLSRYTGVLNVTEGGRYAIVTSSHHCSFLLIDGKEVASHPGRHHRSWDANPELLKHANLTAGKHKFEYYHATADDNTSMLVVWQLNPEAKPTKLTVIPPEAFGGAEIVRVPAGPLSLAGEAGAPDFEFRIMGSVPLPGNDQQMVAVQFMNKTAGMAARGKYSWSFGDGLTSDDNAPGHIFLKPGLYSVELASQTANHRFTTTNRIEIEPLHRPLDPKKEPTLDQYLTVIEKYDATKLPAEALLQLIEAYQAKIDRILNPSAEELAAAEAAMTEGAATEATTERPTRARNRTSPRQVSQEQEEVAKYRRLIAQTVRNALVENPDFKGDAAVYKLALMGGEIARDYLADPKLAGQIYTAAAQKLTFGEFSAECFALAADVALDMQNKDAAKRFLEQAEKKTSKTGQGRPISTFYRVQADYLAETGQAEEARKALTKASETAGSRHQYTEQIALQGSASRSAENFIREKNYDRAIEALRTWQLEYPAAAYDGYITLLFARYWMGREQNELAASLVNRQMMLNPDSAYIDELLLVASDAQLAAGNKDAALAYLNTLIKDLPGSPLIPEAKEKLGKLIGE